MTVPASDESEAWVDYVVDVVTSDVMAIGYCDQVNLSDPDTIPQSGLTAAIWAQNIRTLPLGSGLATSSALVTMVVRFFTSVVAMQPDMVEKSMLRAVSALFRRWHDNYDFGAPELIRNVDALGEFSDGLTATAGYLPVSDAKYFRTYDIQAPIIVNDVWPQNAG